jgi:hypothetical protein
VFDLKNSNEKASLPKNICFRKKKIFSRLDVKFSHMDVALYVIVVVIVLKFQISVTPNGGRFRGGFTLLKYKGEVIWDTGLLLTAIMYL